MINVSSRQFQVVVAGLDVTTLVQHFEVGDDKVSSSGLISTRGTIKLRYNPKFNIGRDPKISLDPKIPNSAKYWARGNSVKLWLDDSTQTLRKHPRHSLRILSTKFDRNELSLIIEVGCLLALLDTPQPEGDESNTCINERRSIDDIIRDLLNGSAKDYQCGEIIPQPGYIPVSIVYLGFVPGYLESPQEKGSGGSYISVAGKLAYDRGYALWVNKDERIKAIKIAPSNSLAKLVLDADRDNFEYVRNDASGSSGEVPYDRIRVSYSVVTLTETKQEYEQVTEEFGITEYTVGDTPVLTRRTVIKDYVEFKSSTRLVETQRWMRSSEIFPWAFTADTEKFGAHPSDLLVLAEIVTEFSVFETPQTLLFDEACKDEGNKDNYGRLRRKTVTVQRARGWIYAEWIEQHYYRPPRGIARVEIEIYQEGIAVLNGDNTSNVATVTGTQAYTPDILLFESLPLETYSTDITDYSYLDGRHGGVEGVQKIETESTIHQAVVYPKAWKMSKRDSNLPNRLISNGGITETWKRHFGAYEWQHKVVERRALGIAFRSICDAKMKKAIEGANSLGVYTVEVDVSRFNSIQKVKKIVQQIVVLNEDIRVSSTQTTPPSPEFIPERYSRTEETVVEEIPLFSDYNTGCTGKIKEIRLDTPVERHKDGSYQSPINGIDPAGLVGLRGVGDDLEQAKKAAEIEALLVWGRYRSINITYDLRDIWFELSQLPLTRFDVYDRDRITEQTYRHSYIVDGWSNAVTLRECLCSHDGLWLGTTGASNPTEILLAATIPPNSTYIEVQPLPYNIQEGDPIVINKTGSLITANTLQGSYVVGLNIPLATTLVAGSQILLGGFVYTVANTVNAGSLSVQLSTPLRSQISSGQIGTSGTITYATTFTPQGSTAIPVQPTTNTTTITNPSVTIEVQPITPPVRVPVNINTTLGIGTVARVFETIPNVNIKTTLGIRYPAGNFNSIGTAYSSFGIGLGFNSTFTSIVNFQATLGIRHSGQQVSQLNAVLGIRHSGIAIPNVNLASTLGIRHRVIIKPEFDPFILLAII
jgi:hypothetical protein